MCRLKDIELENRERKIATLTFNLVELDESLTPYALRKIVINNFILFFTKTVVITVYRFVKLSWRPYDMQDNSTEE